MSPRRGIGIIFWAIILIAVGVLLFFKSYRYDIRIWQALVLYWPILIIAWGLLKVVDYSRFKGESRRLFSKGEVAVLVLVLFVGSALTAAAHLTSHLAFKHINLDEDFDVFDIIGDNYEFAAHIEANVVPGQIVEIHNIYGSLEVESGEHDRIVINVDKTVRAKSREEAERLEPEMYFTITDQGDSYVIESNRDDLRSSLRRRFKTSLTISVPTKSSLNVNNKYGSVRIAGLTGDQEVENRYGGTTIRAINGNVYLENGYGPIVTENVSGNVRIVNKHGSVHVSGIAGDARIDNKHSLVRVENVGGKVQIEGSNNSVDLEDVKGLVKVASSYKDIIVRNVAGRIDLANRHGNIQLLFEVPPRKDISLIGDYTDIRIDMPLASSFSLDAQTYSGSFDSNVEEINRKSSGGAQGVTGKFGEGGPHIMIRTSQGNICLIEKG